MSRLQHTTERSPADGRPADQRYVNSTHKLDGLRVNVTTWADGRVDVELSQDGAYVFEARYHPPGCSKGAASIGGAGELTCYTLHRALTITDPRDRQLWPVEEA